MLASQRPPMVAGLTGPDGYWSGAALTPEELALLREATQRQWGRNLAQAHPELVAEYEKVGLARYHELPVDHAAMFRNRELRLLPAETVAQLREMGFMQELRAWFGPSLRLADEAGTGEENVLLRVVRPGRSEDVGPIHSDVWFWELAPWPIPEGHVMANVWIPLYCEPGKNGLLVEPGSQGREQAYVVEGGRPRYTGALENLQLLPTRPGDVVLFSNRLLHGGAANHGLETRVSLEFTLLVPASKL